MENKLRRKLGTAESMKLKVVRDEEDGDSATTGKRMQTMATKKGRIQLLKMRSWSAYLIRPAQKGQSKWVVRP